MSVQNGERLVTKQDLADFYNEIRPYMGGLVTSKAGFTPIGTIISVMGTTAPVNYLACDGTVYNIADYTELANYFNEQFGSKNFFGGNGTTTFAVPDLRGEFLRGTGTNSHENQGSGENVGVHQDGTEHVNVWLSEEYGNNTNLYVGLNSPTSSTNQPQNVDARTTSTKEGVIALTLRNSNTTQRFTSRPTNTSVLYCIATKNFYIDPTLDYSTDEKVVGTWIDGKPIYQKTVDYGVLPNATSKAITHGITNIDILVNIFGVAIETTSKETRVIPSVNTANLGYGISIDADRNIISISSGTIDRSGYHGYVTLQYTKTT